MSESVFIDLHVNMEPNVLFRGHNYTSRRWHLINPVSYLTSRLKKKKLKWKYGASINHMTPKSAPFYPLPLMTHLAHYKVNGMTIFLSLLTPAPPPSGASYGLWMLANICSCIFYICFFFQCSGPLEVYSSIHDSIVGNEYCMLLWIVIFANLKQIRLGNLANIPCKTVKGI